jgi:hypothetical protein
MSNKYFFRAKISDEKFLMVLRLFCLNIEAKKVAEFTGLNRETVNNIFGGSRLVKFVFSGLMDIF